MAQVKRQILKAQGGAPAPEQSTPKKKYGTFHKGNAELGGEEIYNKLFSLDEAQGGFGATNFAKRQIEAGNDVYLDSDGTLYATDSNGTRINFDESKLKKGQWAKDWEATFNSKNHQERVNLDALRKMSIQQAAAPEPTKKDVRYGGNNWFTYDESKGEDGKTTYSLRTGNNGMFNDDYLQRIEEARQYFTGNREDMDKIWNMKWSNADEIRNYADEWAKEGFHDSLLNAIRTNTFNDDQLKFLKLLGYTKEGTAAVQTTPGVAQAYTDAASVLGTNNAPVLQDMGITVTKGDDGKYRVTGSYNNNDLSQGTWLLGGNYNWFGDNYRWLHNGVLYSAEDADDDINNPSLFNATKKWLSYDGKTATDWWEYHKFGESGIHFSGEDDENPFKDYNSDELFDTAHTGALNDYFTDKGAVAFNDFTNNFDNVPEGTKIYGYVNPETLTNYGTMGDIKYISIDKDGNISDWTQKALKRTRASKGLGEDWSERTKENNNNFIYHRFNLGKEGTENTILTSGSLNSPDRKFYLKTASGNIELDPNKIQDLMDAIRNGSIVNNDMLKNYYLSTSQREQRKEQQVKDRGNAVSSMAKSGVSYYMRRKEGGTINWNRLQKLQYGGGINGSKNTVSANNTAEHNIDRAHNLDGSDGGLTQAERLQIAGALGDLAGVAVSFIPGVGNIAGATTGAAASTTKFIGDIKQDGFQGRDLWGYLGNLGLDATSLLIPAVGKTAKGAKALKTIKNLAQPLMIAAGAMGLTETAGVLGKMVKGEKLTSSDTTKLIQGLSKMTLGTSAAVTVGKEAKTAAKTIGAQNIEALSTVHKFNGKEITNKEISDIINANKSEESAMKAIAKQLGIENATADQISSIKKALNIESVKKWEFDLRKNPTMKASFNDGTADNKSTFGYFMSPRARSKALDAIAGRLTSEQLAAANKAVRTGKYTEEMPKYLAQTYARLAAERPYVFSNTKFGTKPLEQLNRWTLGGTRQLREPLQPYIAPTAEVKKLPKIKVPYNGSSKLFGKTRGKLFSGDINVKVGNRRFDIANYNRVMREYAASRKYITPELLTLDPVQLYFGKQSSLQLPVARPISQIRWTPTVEATPVRNNAGKVLVTTKAGVKKMVRKKEGGELPKLITGNVLPGIAKKISFAGLLDLGSALAQDAAINNSYNIQRDALSELKNRQFQAPQLVHQKFDTSAIEQKYKDAAEPYRIMKFNYSDPNMVLAGQLSKAGALSQLESQKGTELTNYINQYNAQDVATTNQQRQINAELANQKSQYFTNLNYQDKMLDAEKLNEKWANVWSPYLGQIRQQARDNQNQLASLDTNLKLKDLEVEKNKNINSLLLQQFGSAYEADKSANKGTLMDWISSDNKRYSEYQDFISKEEWQKMLNDYYKKAADIQRSSISWIKKGGRIRPTQEQIAIDSNKEAKRAVQKMSDNLFKMLLQLIK